MVAATLVVLAAVGLAAFTRTSGSSASGAAPRPLVARGVAWSALGLLLLNELPVHRGPVRPLVLLDGSLSMGAPVAEQRRGTRASHR